MTTTLDKTFSRRSFIKGSGSLVVGFSMAGALSAPALGQAAPTPGFWPRPPVNQVDSWLEILADNTVIAKFGKGTAHQGTSTGVLQMYADELDVSIDRIKMILGDSYLTADQRGASAENGIETAWVQNRQAAATARQFLLNLASARLGVPVASLTVTDGVVSGTGTAQKVTYGELLAGRKFNLTVSATAPMKTPAQFKVMGKPHLQESIPRIVTGTYRYVHDVRVPGMLYAVNVRPPQAGATLVSVNGPHNLPGVVKVVAKGNYLAVVAKSQWQAIQAANALKVTWKPPAASPLPASYDAFYDYLATAPRIRSQVTNTGNAAAAIASSTKVVEAQYKIDFQSHATVGPFTTVADFRDGSCVVYMGGQKPYDQQVAVADMLATLIDPKIKLENVRVIWYPGASSYGRSEADDVSVEAAYLSAILKAPVRVQWQRSESTSWDMKGAPALVNMRAGLNSSGKVVGFELTSFSVPKIPSSATKLGDTLMGALMGFKPREHQDSFLSYTGYGYPNVSATRYNVPWEQTVGTGLHSAHLRAPTGPQTGFFAEQFEDEIAAAAGMDPVSHRLTYLSNAADRRVVQVAAKESGWAARPSPGPDASSSKTVVTGRGIAVRGNIAVVAVVDVNRKTGKVDVRKITSANDHGFVVNPATIMPTIKSGIMYAISRSLFESVTWDGKKVTSVDWLTYPIPGIEDTPTMKVILVGQDGTGPTGAFTNPSGAGEAPTIPVPAAIGNAIFDATGVRVRRMPMTPKVVLDALKKAGKAL
jgi:CO/xanthine dehydrogenase Mo-binding subunit